MSVSSPAPSGSTLTVTYDDDIAAGADVLLAVLRPSTPADPPPAPGEPDDAPEPPPDEPEASAP